MVVPLTVAVNCCVRVAESETDAGETVTETDGFTVTVAVAFLVGSATLVAVTETVCTLVMDDGAV